MVQHTCRIEGITPLYNGVKNSLTDRLKSREVKETNVRTWQSPGHSIPILYCIVIYGLFSLQTDKMKHYSSVLYCSADQDVHVFSEMIINKRKKNRAAVL